MGTTFKENLRTELDYLDLTVKELSSRTGIAKGTLDCYLGVRASMPPADIAVKIAGALSVSVEYLVTGEEGETRPAYNHTTRSILQIIRSLTERDREILLELARLLKKNPENPES
jgi:transcriptional regulator with XRE-family HTH domain